ncbi:MAG: DUF4906 domain-containing protein [Bacteroidales bacterium]|nr:DUF4906 domain-containing protein [Bacteroidales bacterium]
MRSSLLMTWALSAALLAASCTNDGIVEPSPNNAEANSITFTIRTPAGEKVSYSRADEIHDLPEYAIKTLRLYEYEVITGEDGSKKTSFCRLMKYPTGNGTEVFDITNNGNGSYAFSIVIPASYEGKTYTYRLVANDIPASPAAGSTVEDFRNGLYASVVLADNVVTTDEEGNETSAPTTASALADPDKGIAMSGCATFEGSEEIKIGTTTTCEVELTRVVSRVDIRYQTPNLVLTNIQLMGAPKKGYIFPQVANDGSEAPYIPSVLNSDCITMAFDKARLPEGYLKNQEGKDTEVINKAFYMYERSNYDGNYAYVHLEYDVLADDGTEEGAKYSGELDVPFRSTTADGEGNFNYINAVRNHLYTIVLGNGTDPVAGKVTAKLIVDDWNLIEIDEHITD